MAQDTAVSFSVWVRDAWYSILADIDAAQKSIDIEQYIFSPDTIGQKCIEALIKKAKQGLKVRVLVDGAGSFRFLQSEAPALLHSHGIEVRVYNPISPWRITNFTSNFFRDHRKIAIIDNEIAHLGGVCIQDSMEDWRDTNMRITGSTVEDIVKNFEMVWRNVGQGTLLPFRSQKQILKPYMVLTNGPRLGQRYIYKTLIKHIRNARKYVYLTTPYFIPDARFYRTVRAAARRGVDVRILVPTVSDAPFVHLAGESYFGKALKAGIKIYTYNSVMMHAKTAVVDDIWATAGSFNLDNLSFLFNNEINIASTESGFINLIRYHFLEDIKVSTQLHYPEWIKRPLFNKFLEFLTWPFHSIM